jgi:uncharacterized protein
MGSNFYQQIEAVSDSHPPVELWDPPLSGEMDCLIKRDGSWWIDGSKLENDRLLRLFSTVLKREENNYYLVTPVEKWQIQIEDLPFMVVELEVTNKGTSEQSINVRTNVGDRITIDNDHPVNTSPIDGQQDKQLIPYVQVRSRLMARFNRSTYLEIADLLQTLPDTNQYSLLSANTNFTLSF